jgi:hypothetical protein
MPGGPWTLPETLLQLRRLLGGASCSSDVGPAAAKLSGNSNVVLVTFNGTIQGFDAPDLSTLYMKIQFLSRSKRINVLYQY